MNSYVIIGDVTCDLSNELRERFKIDGYIKGHITLPDGNEVLSKLEWDSVTPEDFYRDLKKAKKNSYKTSPPSTEEIVIYVEEFLKKGKDVLLVSISSALSATYNLMVNAQKILQDKYPNRKVIVIDSRRYSAASGLLIMKAAELRDKGLSIEENADKLNEIKTTIHQMGMMDDLYFVASKGRISYAKAFMGTLVGIKTMADFDSNGMVTVLSKVKSYEKGYEVIVEYIKKTIIEPEKQIIMIAQTSRIAHAKILIDLIKENIKPKEIILTDIYPADGINTGPGLLAAYYLGAPITDLAKEKEIMKSIMEA